MYVSFRYILCRYSVVIMSQNNYSHRSSLTNIESEFSAEFFPRTGTGERFDEVVAFDEYNSIARPRVR